MVGAIVGTGGLLLQLRYVFPGRISNLTLTTLGPHAIRCSGGAQIVVSTAQNPRGIAAGLLRYHGPVSRRHQGRADRRYRPSASPRNGNGQRFRDMKRDGDEVPQSIRHGGSLPCHAFPGRWFLALLRRHDPDARRLLMATMVQDTRWRIPCRHRATSVGRPTRFFRNICASSDA